MKSLTEMTGSMLPETTTAPVYPNRAGRSLPNARRDTSDHTLYTNSSPMTKPNSTLTTIRKMCNALRIPYCPPLCRNGRYAAVSL